MFEYFTDFTLGLVPFLVDGENYCHEEQVNLQTMPRGSIGGI